MNEVKKDYFLRPFSAFLSDVLFRGKRSGLAVLTSSKLVVK